MKMLLYRIKKEIKFLSKWFMISSVTGVAAGIVGTLFYFTLSYANSIRNEHNYLVLALPLGGLIIAYIYSKLEEDKKGTNLVLDAIRSDKEVPLHMAPVIFVSTAITHLFGGSAGREGAALQMGGSIGNGIGRLFKLNKMDKPIIIMCGMSAAFSAVFGTPIAATFFSIEVVNIGVMQYSALIPCSIASILGYEVASYFGAKPELFTLHAIPDMTLITILKVIIIGAVCAAVSILFCKLLHTSHDLFKKYIPNNYLAIATGGILIIIISGILRSTDYLGAGMETIAMAIEEGRVVPYAFALKMLFTAITLGCGYKGGEIVPSFFVGATLGCALGSLLGISPTLCAALGMIAVFCGVTNSPITSLLLSFELFHYTGVFYFLLVIAVSYGLSGYSSLYHSQCIVYSKHKSRPRQIEHV